MNEYDRGKETHYGHKQSPKQRIAAQRNWGIRSLRFAHGSCNRVIDLMDIDQPEDQEIALYLDRALGALEGALDLLGARRGA